MTIQVNKIKQLFTELKPYDYMAKDDSFISLTEWHNGEGFDVEINSGNRTQIFQLTHGEWTALQVLANYRD